MNDEPIGKSHRSRRDQMSMEKNNSLPNPKRVRWRIVMLFPRNFATKYNKTAIGYKFFPPKLLKINSTKFFSKNYFEKYLVYFYNCLFYLITAFWFVLFFCIGKYNPFAFYGKLEKHTQFKQANPIWFLGKNNFDRFSFCRGFLCRQKR
jgi:hypothetical protein